MINPLFVPPSLNTPPASLLNLLIGYGRVGKMVCNMLDRLPVRYIALDSSPGIAIEARGKGLPVFYGKQSFLQRLIL
jgi:monovalent cation:H+ antiporter-2, CPA2 family